MQTRQLALRRYEQAEDALVKDNPWFDKDPSNPLSYSQAEWTAWEWALGAPASHRPWLEITKKLQAERVPEQQAAPF